jgi:hypothetical protein
MVANRQVLTDSTTCRGAARCAPACRAFDWTHYSYGLLLILRTVATARLPSFRLAAIGLDHRTIEFTIDILMQGQRTNKGQSGAMA